MRFSKLVKPWHIWWESEEKYLKLSQGSGGGTKQINLKDYKRELELLKQYEHETGGNVTGDQEDDLLGAEEVYEESQSADKVYV